MAESGGYMLLNQHYQLPDGRRLEFDERGAPAGKPLFYFHGSPSSRLESTLYITGQILESLEVRLISIDRPGMGRSDFQPGRRLLDWPQDVLALADHLKIERFAVLAYSLGGPYGAACAYAIPERLTNVGIISGAALFTHPQLMGAVNDGTRRFLNLPRENPVASRLFLVVMIGLMPRLAPNRFIAGAASVLPDVDRQVIHSDPAFQTGFLKMVREAARAGTHGAYHEALLTISDWGFGLPGIQTPVLLWHGQEDRNIPVEMARYMAESIPGCQASFYPGEGHLSLFKKYATEIIQSLIVSASDDRRGNAFGV